MLLAISAVDYGVLALYLLAMLAIGFYFNKQQKTSRDFFLAGRSMGWFPVGLSIMATLLSAMTYSGNPGEAYYSGLKMLILPCAVWLVAPILLWLVLPLYHGLNIYSVYEYLEMRYDAVTRYVGSAIFIVWRLLWLGGVLYAPCKVLVVAAGLDMPIWVLMIVLGVVSTAYTFLGGMKAVIWTDVIQAIVMVLGVVLIIGSVWLALGDGPQRVWEVNQHLDRSEIVDASFSLSERWSIWGILPHFALAMLSFYVADQITAQRYLTAKSLVAARRSFVLNCLSVSIMVPALLYVGMALLAYYHDHPQDMAAKWVVNVDNRETSGSVGASFVVPEENWPAIPAADERPDAAQEDATRESEAQQASLPDDVAPGGAAQNESAPEEPLPVAMKPLIDWDNDEVSAETVEDLIAERRLLRPNSYEPFESVDEVLDPQSGEIDIQRVAKRQPPPLSGKLDRGEIVLNKKAQDELMPHFISRKLSMGVAGLILAALLAASMSSMDSGLNSICTLLIMDFHRRLGWGRNWLAKKLDKPVDQLDEADELRLGRPLVLIIGVAATLFSLLVGQLGSIWGIMIGVVNTVGVPLLCVFLLGILSRRTTAAGALTALVSGTLFTAWLAAPSILPALSWLWPFDVKLSNNWPVVFGAVFTLLVGYLASLVLGRVKSAEQLRGLTLGMGKLGDRSQPEKKETLKISIGDE
ncbi:MAG: hypothetical protein RIC55_29950 [Pirellulaceae bacterium]